MTADDWPALGPDGQFVSHKDNVGLQEAALHLEEFWYRRPELRAIYENARRRVRAPWSMLGLAIIRSIHSIPYHVKFHSSLGPASLNMALVLVGDSGGGKSILSRIMDECLPFLTGFGVREFRGVEVGSGEALAEQFASVAQRDDPDQDVRKGDLVFRNKDHSEMFVFDEIGRLLRMHAREGNTVYEYIKTGWSGGTFGRKLVGGGGVMLTEDDYRMTVVLNAQPARCGPLFTEDEIAGGITGRMLWLSTRDPDARREYHRLEGPIVPHQVKDIDWSRIKAIRSLPEMDEEYHEDGFGAHEEHRSPLDGHRLMVQTKVALGLMRLNGRVNLDPEDWDLAQLVMQESHRVRGEIQQKVQEVADREAERRGLALARQNVATENASRDLHVRRVANLLEKYRAQGIQEKDWKRRTNSDNYPYYDDALALVKGTKA